MSRNILKSNSSFIGAAFLSDKEAFHTDDKNLNLFNLTQTASFSVDLSHERLKQLGSNDYAVNDPFTQPDVQLSISYIPNVDLNNERFNFFSSGSLNGLRPALSGTTNASTNFYIFNDPNQGFDALNSINLGASSTVNYTVTVQSVGGGNRYFIDGVQQPTLELIEGNTYVFDWSAATSHPVRFSETSDGTHGGGSEYTNGVTKDDGNHKITIVVAAGAPTLYYYCQYHAGMGGQANTPSSANNFANYEVLAFGNAFLTDYSVNYEIGGMPLVATSYICSNMKFETAAGTSMESVAINLESGNNDSVGNCNFNFTNGSKTPTIIRPVGNNQSSVTMQNLQVGGQVLSGLHLLQSVNLNVSLPRISSYGLGSDYAYNRKFQSPAQGSFTSTSLVSGFSEGNITGVLSNESGYSFDLVFKSGSQECLYRVENAKLESYSYSMEVNEQMSFNSSFSFPVTEDGGLLISGLSGQA
tara:strand:+ start:4266 stop:5678 length:1413 start_codon:yes stop_codon:yes gene_type:complete